MLQRRVVVWLCVADGADDAGLVVRQRGDGNVGRAAQRGIAALGGDDQAAFDARAAGDLDGGAIFAPFHLGHGGREDAQGRQGVHVRVQGDAQAACLHHPAERRGIAGLTVIEVEEQRRGWAAEAAIADADVEDRTGGFGQPIPDAGGLQELARAGGDGKGAAVEGGMLHRRERRAVDNDGGNTGGGQAAGERAAYGAGADDTDLGRKVIAHAAESGAVATVAASVGNGASAIRGFRHIVAATHEPLEPHGHRPSRRGTQSCLADDQGVDQPAVGGADRAGARAAWIGAAGRAGLLRSARSITEHGHLAAHQQPGGTGGGGAGRPVAARLRRGRRATGVGDADVGLANRVAPRAGQHGGTAGGAACGFACACSGAG